ncbi:MAG: hypothetical protein ABJR46_16540 [Tateyamaria sp.]
MTSILAKPCLIILFLISFFRGERVSVSLSLGIFVSVSLEHTLLR